MSDETKTETTAAAGKAFSQDDVDRIVETRLSRERSKYEAQLADAEKAKAEAATLSEKLKTLDTLSATAAEKDKLIEEVHAGLLSGIPEELRGLIPDTLSKADAIRYIQKNKAHLFPPTGNAEPKPLATPSNPSDPVAKATNGALPNGYKSLTEFATRDPRGFSKWDKEHP